MRDWIRDFSSRIKKIGNDDLFPLWECDTSERGVTCVRDYAAFIQMVGKMHFLATHPEMRSDKSDHQVYKVFYRGQRNYHNRLLKPYAYRGKNPKHEEVDGEIKQWIHTIKQTRLVKGLAAEHSDEVVEALLQQYGGRTRWLDVVDNIWVALWFACMRTFSAYDEGTGLDFVEYRVRDCRCERESKRFAYIHVVTVKDGKGSYYIAENDELLDLRNELPSFYIRPHAQHAVMVRRRNNDGFADDYRDMIVATIKIPLDIALTWLGSCMPESLSVMSMFPSPYFDTGWRDLLIAQTQAKVFVFKQMICA